VISDGDLASRFLSRDKVNKKESKLMRKNQFLTLDKFGKQKNNRKADIFP